MTRGAAVLSLAAAWLAIAADVLYGGPLCALDGWLAGRVHVSRHSLFSLALLFWANLHSYVAILAYAALFSLILARRRAWPWVIGVALAVPGALLLNAALNAAIQRSPAVRDDPVLALDTYSFPSTHAAASFALYGMLAAWLVICLGRVHAWHAGGAR